MGPDLTQRSPRESRQGSLPLSTPLLSPHLCTSKLDTVSGRVWTLPLAHHAFALGRGTDIQVRTPGSKSHNFLSPCPWVSHLTPLALAFLCLCHRTTVSATVKEPWSHKVGQLLAVSLYSSYMVPLARLPSCIVTKANDHLFSFPSPTHILAQTNHTRGPVDTINF